MIERAQAQLGTTTWGDLLARRLDKPGRHRLVGRRYEQEQFRLNYLYEVPQVLLYVLQGPAGIGKTALLTRFRRIAEEHRGLTAVVDRSQLTLPREFAIVQAMELLADQLAAAGTPLTSYREVYREYLHTVDTIDADSTAPARVWSLFDGAADPDPWAQKAWETYFTRTMSLRQSALIRDPVGTLTERFVQDLNAWAVVRRMVLCFDGWGRADRADEGSRSPLLSLDTWLPTLLSRGQLSTHIWFILTTRAPLDSRWEPLVPVTRTFELQPLPKKESASLLQAPSAQDQAVRSNGRPAGTLSESEVAAVVEQAKGSPLTLALLSSSRWPAAGGKLGTETLADETAALNRYIDSLKPVQQAALLKCTAARWLDEGVLGVLLGEEAGRRAREDLALSPLVDESKGPLHFRSTLRAPLHQSACARIGPAWEAAHQTLFAYYRQRVELEGPKPHYLDVPWRHDRLEALYHELVQNDDTDSCRHVLLSFLEGLQRFYPWAGAVALTWLDAIDVRSSTSRAAEGQQVAKKVHEAWEALVERRWEESLALVDELMASEELSEPLLMEDVREQLAGLRHLIASRLALPLAAEPEKAAVNVGPTDAKLVAQPEPVTTPAPVSGAANNTGVSAQPAGQVALPGAALDTAGETSDDASTTSAVDLTPDSCELDEVVTGDTEAEKESGRTRAIGLCSDANAQLRQGDYETAIRGYDEALAHSPDYIAAYYNRGSAYAHIGALDGAIADFTRVLELDPTQAPAYRQRGLIYTRKGDYGRAIEDYDAALALMSERGAAHAESGTADAVVYDRAQAYFRLGSYEQALADYATVLDHAPQQVEAHLNRGLTYAALGNYPEALRDFNQAIVLAPQQALSYHHRGQVYARVGRYTEALKDYDRALELNPRYAGVHNNRGLLYVKIEAYQEAVDAYQQAMALQPDWATPYYNAACAAALMGDVEHACIWLARAIGLREAYRAMAVRDPDLATIRPHPGFRALVETAG
jgi:tetratricopeptide (TPR) repeat protein